MARTLLQLVQQAANEIGLPEPTQLFGSLDEQSKQLLALAIREGTEFAEKATRSGGWQALHLEHTFDTVAGVAAYDLPSDLEYFAYKTFWDDSYKWELIGPITAEEKQILKYGVIASGPRRKFYIRDNKMYIDPVPDTGGQTLAYDYYSNHWCKDENGQLQPRWMADTDTYVLDEDCFIMGMKWRFLRSKGLSYDQEETDYEVKASRLIARDGGNRPLPLADGVYGARLLSDDNLPETGYGS